MLARLTLAIVSLMLALVLMALAVGFDMLAKLRASHGFEALVFVLPACCGAGWSGRPTLRSAGLR